jgi:peptide/nickel transport system permease protein
MTGYILRRIGAAVIVLFIASLLVFFGVRALPGDPALALAGEDRSAKAVEQIREKYGLDKPVPVQFVDYLGHVVRGDLGQSSHTGLDVLDTIVNRLPVTLELAALSLLLATLLGIGAGVVSAVRRGTAADVGANLAALLGLSIPNFWLGLLLILVFSVTLGVLPASGFVAFTDDPLDNLRHLIMPAIVLGSGLAALLMRQTRATMLESLNADYVRTARAKGLSERQVVGGHALRNSLITVVTVLGLELGTIISGAVVTEQVFVLPGFGKLTVDAVFQRDFPLIQGVVLFTTVAYVVINLVVDLLYSVIDPRIRVGKGAA